MRNWRPFLQMNGVERGAASRGPWDGAGDVRDSREMRNQDEAEGR